MFRGTACCSSSSISVLESSTNRLEFSAISREIFRDKIFNTTGFEFRGQFPYLDKLQYTGFIQWVESQSGYQKFNIQCLVFNNTGYPASDEPIRARVECYSPRWQILNVNICFNWVRIYVRYDCSNFLLFTPVLSKNPLWLPPASSIGGGGVLDLSLGWGCRPDLEILTLFMIKSSWKSCKIDTLFMIFRFTSTHSFVKMREF